MALVSIVLPTYNQARYLLPCFDACWFQSWPELEIIIVDGGSTDETKEILAGLPRLIEERRASPVLCADEAGKAVCKECASYLEDTHAAHPRREVRILSYDDNIGRNATYEAGFTAARGEFCTYVVGDDLPHPHMIEELALALMRTGADLAYADFTVVTDEGRILRLVRKPDYSYEACFAAWFHLGVCTLHRRALHERFGLFPEEYGMANDYAWYLRMAQGGARFVHVPRVLYSVRHHGHGPALHDESGGLALKAREFLRTGTPNI